MTTDETREAWLGRVANALAVCEHALGNYDVPPVRLSVSWPGGGDKRTRVGECWPTTSTVDGISQIFVTPMRGEDSTVDVIATVCHELIHAIDDCASGHGGDFRKIAKAIGFGPKFTKSGSRSDELTAVFEGIAAEVGPFPHAEIILGGRAADAPAPQKGRQLKVACPDCPCIVRMSRKAIDEVGTPTCACGAKMEES